MNKKEIEIIKAKFKAKSWSILETDISKNFNGCHIIIEDKVIIVVKKYYVDKLLVVDIEDNAKK